MFALLASAAGLVCADVPSVARATGGFPLRALREVPVAASGSPRGLAFSPDGSLAYLAIGRTLLAYDAAAATQTGRLDLAGSAADLAIAPQGDVAYAALRKPDAIAVVSLRPLRVLRVLPLPAAPSALLVGVDGRSLYVVSSAAGRVLNVDAASGRVVSNVRLQGRLTQIAQNGYGHLFVAIADRDAVDVLDEQSLRLTGIVPVPNCDRPAGVALDPVGRRLFVSCASGGIAVIDSDIGFTFQRLPAPAGLTRGLFVRAPLGAGGWKGAAFFAGPAGVLGAVRMLAFIRYADGGHMPVPAGTDLLAFDAARGQLWLALPAKTGGAPAGTLLILGASTSAPGAKE